VTRQYDATLLTECNVTGDKTRRAHTVEDIICYSYPLVPYCIGFYIPWGHLLGLESHCNCPALSYKRPGQTPVLDRFSLQGKFNPRLEQHTKIQQLPFFTFGFLLLQVVIPAMTLRPHSLRLKMAVVQQQFHLLRAPPLRVYFRR
jgi:hypothetical protein